MSNFITLNCPSCGGKIRIQSGTKKFICDYCGNEHFIPGLMNDAKDDLETNQIMIPVPEGVEFKDEMQFLRIERRWFSWKYIPMAFFCVAWDAFLFFWYSMAFSSHAPWIMIVFPIAHVAVGIGLTYSTLAGFINKTILELTPEWLEIWHEPLPWLGESRIATREIKQLYCTDSVTHTENGSSIHYNLIMVDPAGKAKRILKGLESKDVAIFMEQQVERWLNIPDRPVPGELSRK